MLATAVIAVWGLARPLGLSQLSGIDPSQLVVALNLADGELLRLALLPVWGGTGPGAAYSTAPLLLCVPDMEGVEQLAASWIHALRRR